MRRVVDHSNGTLVIGHRGASARLPENTLDAFRGAIADGADGVELDVRLSADGLPVVIHDATLERTTPVRGRVSDVAAPDLEAVGVPTLRSALDLLSAHRAVVFVELKGGGDDLERAVARELCHRDCYERATVLSFNHAALRRVREIDERLETAATVAPTLRMPRPSPARIVEIVERAEASAAALHVSLATRRRIDALHDRGLGALVWTVNSPVVARRIARFGADAVMTDAPARLAELSKRART